MADGVDCLCTARGLVARTEDSGSGVCFAGWEGGVQLADVRGNVAHNDGTTDSGEPKRAG